MKEIIFWFSNHKIRNYWLDYTIAFFRKKDIFECIEYNRIGNWIQILYYDFKILFKVNDRGDSDLSGYWDKNQYWVEELFDNNFEEFFIELIKENIDGEERNFDFRYDKIRIS